MIYTIKDIDILARTIYGEARGESYDGQIAVAHVVLNRVLANTWYGKNIMEVCLKPLQFSCWNASDPNYKLITIVTEENPIFLQCKGIASLVIVRQLPDLSRGATHYHTIDSRPSWIHNMIPTVNIGHHMFYREV